jgi:hypothetical protein
MDDASQPRRGGEVNDSLRLLLEDYLGLMREEGELDVFLPLLLSAMGHVIVSPSQKGGRQFGVDISSVGPGTQGGPTYFMWLVKRGAIDRAAWNNGPQSVRQSMDDVGDVYLKSHVHRQYRSHPKQLVVLTNGDFNQTLKSTIKGYSDGWAQRYAAEVKLVNGSQLAAWTEAHLLGEYVLTAPNRALLRRLLSTTETPEFAFPVGCQLVDALVSTIRLPDGSPAAKRKRLLMVLRGLRMSLGVLQLWSQDANNLATPYRVCEYAVLRVWQELHVDIQAGNKDVVTEYLGILSRLTLAANAYHLRLLPYYQIQDGFVTALPESLLVTNRVFEELGRLGLQGCLAASFAVRERSPVATSVATNYLTMVEVLLQTHQCANSPAFDHQAVDVHVALTLLAIGGRREASHRWVKALVERFAHVLRGNQKYLPSSGGFDDVLAIHHDYAEPVEEFYNTTTLVPILLLWTAALGMTDGYEFLRAQVVPHLKGSTMNLWNPGEGFDAIVADGPALQRSGVGMPLEMVPSTPTDFLAMLGEAAPVLPSIEKAAWYQTSAAYIPLMSAVVFRLQIPREMLIRQTLAVTRRSDTPSLTRRKPLGSRSPPEAYVPANGGPRPTREL